MTFDFKNNKKKLVFIGLYLFILGYILTIQQEKTEHILIQSLLVIFLWYVPFRFTFYFKAVNIFILAFVLNRLASSVIGSQGTNLYALILYGMVFTAMVVSIFVVINEFYNRNSKVEKARLGSGLKFLSLIIIFIVLIMSIVISFGTIYGSIYDLSDHTFNISEGVMFNPYYYSCITYFTVGFGDIVPLTPLARGYSMIQMILGYSVTCLVVPTLLVAIQRFTKE